MAGRVLAAKMRLDHSFVAVILKTSTRFAPMASQIARRPGLAPAGCLRGLGLSLAGDRRSTPAPYHQ